MSDELLMHLVTPHNLVARAKALKMEIDQELRENAQYNGPDPDTKRTAEKQIKSDMLKLFLEWIKEEELAHHSKRIKAQWGI